MDVWWRIRGRTRRARRARRRAAIGGAVVLMLLALWRPCGGTDAQEEAKTPELPGDRLLTLTSPTLRNLAPPGEFDAVDFDEAGARRPHWAEGELQAGQSLGAALAEAGVAPAAAHAPLQALGELFDFRRAQVGHRFEVELDSEGAVLVMRYLTAPERALEARRAEDGSWDASEVEVELDVELHSLAGILRSNVYQAVSDAGGDAALAQRFVDVFRWDIDFGRDARPGDALRFLYERVYLHGEFLRYGRVVAAEYRGARRAERAYFFEKDDERGYFTPEGEPLRRMFLAAPVRASRISSPFNPDRMHPVLGVRRPHLGVDYAAPTGTPVWAAADGTVRVASYRGAYGNLVVIRHRDGYETAYAHLHRIGRGIRPGVQVRQGQVIGTVGTTGLSTGPHLHYELRLNGRHIDPLGHRHQRGAPLRGRALADFQRQQSRLDALLSEIPIPEVHALGDEDDFFHGEYEDLHFNDAISEP